MKIVYDKRTDTLTAIFSDRRVAESDEDKPGTILDYDESGNLVSIEILDASRRMNVSEPVEYQIIKASNVGRVEARNPTRLPRSDSGMRD